MIMCFSAFRIDGRIVLAEELLNSWYGYAEQRLADNTLVGSEGRRNIAAIRLSFDGGLDEWQWVLHRGNEDTIDIAGVDVKVYVSGCGTPE